MVRLRSAEVVEFRFKVKFEATRGAIASSWRATYEAVASSSAMFLLNQFEQDLKVQGAEASAAQDEGRWMTGDGIGFEQLLHVFAPSRK